MAIEVPEDALGLVVGVLIYSIICLLGSLIVIWLTSVHRERTSYVALLAYFTTISTTASVIQQINDMTTWPDLKAEKFKVAQSQEGDIVAALKAPDGIYGLDFVLYVIQVYSYNVQSLLTVFWATTLAYSVFGIRRSALTKRLPVSKISKALAVLFPVLVVFITRTDAVSSNLLGFMVLVNVQMVFSMCVGSVLLFAILVKYVYTRRKFLSWNVTYGAASGTHPSGARSPGLPSINSTKKNINDRWLLVRFSIAFVLMAAFELFTTLFELRTISSLQLNQTSEKPNLSADQARSDFISFMPGVTSSLLTFIVFGTTTPFRNYIRKKILPKRFQRQSRYDLEAGDQPRVGGGSKLKSTTSTRTSRPRSGSVAGAVVVTSTIAVKTENLEHSPGAGQTSFVRSTSCAPSEDSEGIRLQEYGGTHVRYSVGDESPILKATDGNMLPGRAF